MRTLALLATVFVAGPVAAEPSVFAVAYAFAVGPSAYCDVRIDMVKAGQYVLDHRLDHNEIGQLVWAEQQKVYSLNSYEKASYCEKVATAAVNIGIAD